MIFTNVHIHSHKKKTNKRRKTLFAFFFPQGILERNTLKNAIKFFFFLDIVPFWNPFHDHMGIQAQGISP